ncbi:unnamed protein product [Enterobius vermicularis]|uniref:DUF3752 domain-containing protein n=1 Tax=Enterobius vermicularis TaxID=51028 RepID=A0A0N4VEY1_ENTVE|nr:unnamed protein product [Enterobius vermicularis]
MSSPKTSCDHNMQLPSLEELDSSEQLESNSSDQDDRENEDELSGVKSFFPALLPGDEPGPSQSNDFQEQHQYIPPDVRHDQNSRSSLYDQLPNSIGEQSVNEQDHLQQPVIGPSLPPGFLSHDNNDYDEDPEDPGDPEDPEESDNKSSLPKIPSNMSSLYSRPTLPSGFVQAPSLPDEEIRTSYGSMEGYSTVQIPPPEPASVRSSTWQHSSNYKRGYSKPSIGPMCPPDVLPTVSNSNKGISADRNESEDEVYGPCLPPEVVPGPSHQTSSIEMPIEGDEHSNQQDVDNIIGEVKSSRREEWMVQLPKKLGGYGLGPRTFSLGNDSSAGDDHAKREWTETPFEREKRLAADVAGDAGPSQQDSWERKRNAESDGAQERRAEELNKNRNLSLLEIHQRKRKGDAEETSSEKKIRQPFDREKDMEVKGLGRNLSTSEIKERMGQLNSRFACSSSKKYL